MGDFTHNVPRAKREDVVKEILYHIQTSFRIVDVQDCISMAEYIKMKEVKKELEELFEKEN